MSSSSTSTQSSSALNMNPNVVTAILVLSITIIASTCLCLLLRFLIRRCASSSSSSSSSHQTAANNNPTHTTPSLIHVTTATISSSSRFSSSSNRVAPQQQHQIDDDDASIINSLPLFTYASITRNNNRTTSANRSSDCAVCLSEFEPHDTLRLLPICCHAFHADCVDTWLHSNQAKTCPLCRSLIFASEEDILNKVLAASTADVAARTTTGRSFRIELGNVSRSRDHQHSSSLGGGASQRSSSYSVGSSFEYVIEETESEIAAADTTTTTTYRRRVPEEEKEPAWTASSVSLAREVGAGGGSRSWLRDYVDRLSASVSSRTMSFRGSGRFFGSDRSRNNEFVAAAGGEYDVEANSRAGEEITEMFRWFSGV